MYHCHPWRQEASILEGNCDSGCIYESQRGYRRYSSRKSRDSRNTWYINVRLHSGLAAGLEVSRIERVLAIHRQYDSATYKVIGTRPGDSNLMEPIYEQRCHEALIDGLPHRGPASYWKNSLTEKYGKAVLGEGVYS
jgi:hypothetical protein